MDDQPDKRIGERRAADRRANGERRSEDRRAVPVEWREDPAARAGLLKRLLARLADLLVAGLLISLGEWSFVFPLAGLFYLLVADGLFRGAGPGKLLIGIQTVFIHSGEPASYRESVIRNLPFCLPVCLLLVPVLGWLLFCVLLPVVAAFEGYLAWSDESGRRLGDSLAGTIVVEYRDRPSGEGPA